MARVKTTPMTWFVHFTDGNANEYLYEIKARTASSARNKVIKMLAGRHSEVSAKVHGVLCSAPRDGLEDPTPILSFNRDYRWSSLAWDYLESEASDSSEASSAVG